MKCLKCNKDLKIRLASKAICDGCEILSEITSVITIRCSCGNIMQISVQGKKFAGLEKS